MSNEVLAKVAALKMMPVGQLKKLWRELYRTEPPEFNRTYLTSRLTYRIQELAWGGDSEVLEKRMAARARIVLSADSRQKRKSKINRPPVGTRLLREYQGVQYRVTILADGFAFEGRKYRSLSRIAQIITGMAWSGPAFFGLTPSTAAGRKEKA